MAGKGSRLRQAQVSAAIVSDNWDRIFGINNPEDKVSNSISYMAGKNVCDVWDNGWCYHKDAVKNTACPGISRCNIMV